MRFGPEDMTPPAGHELHQPRLFVLQINTSGAWSKVLCFNAADVPQEGFDYFDKFLRLMADSSVTARVVRGQPGANGGTVASQQVCMRWSRDKGWVDV